MTLLDVPATAQSSGWTCLPTCICMVLAFLGKTHTESEIAAACETVPLRGTRPENAVQGIQRLGYQALWFEYADIERLRNLINQSWPVVVFLRSSDLPHGRSGLHCVVITGFDDATSTVIAQDPALGGELVLTSSDFMTAWTALDSQGLVIWL